MTNVPHEDENQHVHYRHYQVEQAGKPQNWASDITPGDRVALVTDAGDFEAFGVVYLITTHGGIYVRTDDDRLLVRYPWRVMLAADYQALQHDRDAIAMAVSYACLAGGA